MSRHSTTTAVRGHNRASPAQAIRARLALELEHHEFLSIRAPTIADHTLLHRIGNGSYGEVWLARNALGTLRAIKIVYRSRFKEDRPYEREFEGILKYEPVSRTHEGLVQVLHVGRNDSVGCFYYVMELADDANAPAPPREGHAASSNLASLSSYQSRTLGTELARRARLRPSEAACLVLQLAKALGHLHQHCLVHRDIKPSNVIFVAGQPRLADIGLVTDVGSSRSFVGTEGFIPPEGPGTPQADLYSLGKLLYELATGRDRMEFPQLPPHLPQLPEAEALLELNEIITRACAPNPGDRYATATELQADLNSFLAGRSLRRARTLERHLDLLKKITALACGFLAILAFALWSSKREERHARDLARIANDRAWSESQSRARETSLRHRAEAAEQQARQQLYTALLGQARATVRSREPGQRFHTLEALRGAAAISNTAELRGEAIAALALPDLRFEELLPFPAHFTLRSLDPSFQRIAICSGRGPVEIRSVPDNQLLATLPASTNLIAYGATWSGNGRYLAIKRDYAHDGTRGDLEVWDLDQLRQVLLLRDVRYNARAFHPQHPEILVAQERARISSWNLQHAALSSRLDLDAIPQNLAYSPDGHFLALSSRFTNAWAVSIHSAETGELLLRHYLTNFPSALVWQPHGPRLAVTDYGGRVHLIDVRTDELRSLGRHKAEAATALFSACGNYLFTGGWERELICWDVRTFQRALTVALDSYIAQFRSDGRSCALLTQNGIALHEFACSTVHRELSPEIGPRLWHASLSPDGRFLAAAGDRTLGLWDLSSQAPGLTVRIAPESQLFWAPSSRELFATSRQENVLRWRVHPSAAHPSLEPLPLSLPSGFESFCLVSNLVVWTSSLGSRTNSIEDPGRPSHWVKTARGISRASPDVRWLTIHRAYDPILHIYSLPTLQPVAQLTNRAAIAGINFSPDGHELAVASRGQVEFWNTATWQPTRAATNFIGTPHLGMLFEPSGRALWLMKGYNSAGLYDSTLFTPILTLPNGMLPLALDPAGRYLVLSQDAERLQVWDLPALRSQLRELGLDW